MRKLTANQTKKIAAHIAAHRAKAEAEAVLAAGRDDVLAIVASRGGAVSHDGAKLSVEASVSWTYTGTVQASAAQLNAMRKAERDTGKAKKTESEKLVCRDSR